MATLNSTKYPNNSRVVFGTVSVYPNDSILLCNTTLGAVTINLDTIPANYWNTTWKLYVKDNTNNASVNNITINAGVGQTINGQASLVLSGNGQSTIIRISSNNTYLSDVPDGYTTIQDEGVALPQRQILDFQGANVTATDNGSKTIVTITAPVPPPAFDIIDITYAAFNALVVANTVQKGWFYRITDAGFTDEGAIIQGTTTNTNSVQGSGIFLNADYQNVGNYSGVSGFVSNLGLWSTIVQPVVVGNVVIWNNKHWKNLTGSWGNDPDTDAVNWQLLSKSTTNGYIKQIDSIIYDFSNNRVIFRGDKRGNNVEWSINNPQAFNLFKWGDNNTNNNTVSTGSIINNCNGYGVFNNNLVSGNSIFSNYAKYTTNLPIIENNELKNNSSITLNNFIQGSFIKNNLNSSSGITVNSMDSTSRIDSITGTNNSYISIYDLVNSVIEAIEVSAGGGFILQFVTTNGYFNRLNISQRNFILTNSTNQNFGYCTLSQSYSTFNVALDMNDTSIYDMLTQTLTIATDLRFFGIVTLLNCTGKTILKIDGVDTFDKIFIPNVGETVTFQHTLISASTTNSLVCDAPASANLLTGRANGSDYIVYKFLGATNLRSNMVLLA